MEVVQLPHPCLVLKTLSQWMEGDVVGGGLARALLPVMNIYVTSLRGFYWRKPLSFVLVTRGFPLGSGSFPGSKLNSTKSFVTSNFK